VTVQQQYVMDKRVQYEGHAEDTGEVGTIEADNRRFDGPREANSALSSRPYFPKLSPMRIFPRVSNELPPCASADVGGTTMKAGRRRRRRVGHWPARRLATEAEKGPTARLAVMAEDDRQAVAAAG